jgi:hypothetical protein
MPASPAAVQALIAQHGGVRAEIANAHANNQPVGDAYERKLAKRVEIEEAIAEDAIPCDFCSTHPVGNKPDGSDYEIACRVCNHATDGRPYKIATGNNPNQVTSAWDDLNGG